MTSPIPISAAKEIATQFGYDQVIIYARVVGESRNGIAEHMTTYGKDKANCDAAAKIGNFLKYKIMGWLLNKEVPPLVEGINKGGKNDLQSLSERPAPPPAFKSRDKVESRTDKIARLQKEIGDRQSELHHLVLGDQTKCVAMPSLEAVKANEDLLERMSNTDASNFDPKLRVLSGKSQLSSTHHADPRMHLTLTDMASCYNPPQKPLREVGLVIKRQHKTQQETEAEEVK